MGDSQLQGANDPSHDGALLNPQALFEVLEQAHAEHRALDVRIQELSAALYLSVEQETEVHRLKKIKLHKKEEITRLEAKLPKPDPQAAS